jgi:Carboxypeptidase regulatory-like domain/TonB dependent receptor-like, beta-barrel
VAQALVRSEFLRRSSRLSTGRSGSLVVFLSVLLSAGTITSVQAQISSEIHGTVTDQQGLPIVAAVVLIRADGTGIATTLATSPDGSYRTVGLPPGTYTVTASHVGFTTTLYSHLDLTVNRRLQLDITLVVSGQQERITVEAVPPFIETGSSSSGSTVTRKQVESMPILSRNYLELLQLVPGVAINRTADAKCDAATPILGERANNAYTMIDGMPNRDDFDGGAAIPFALDSIQELQVMTSGYKAEFGRGSGGIVNAATKSGTNAWHGSTSLFHRNSALDSADVQDSSVPFLRHWATSGTIGGPLVKDRAFLFGAAEKIRETRESNFQYPEDFPLALERIEESIDRPGEVSESRGFVKLDEALGRHRLTQELNITNAHLDDSGDQPSTRSNVAQRRLMIGLRDTALWGDRGNPYLFSAYAQYRDEPSNSRPAHLELGLPSTFVNLFSGLETGELFGDATQETIGPGFSGSRLDEQSVAWGLNLTRQLSAHVVKFGWDAQRTRVNGAEGTQIFDLVLATVSDFERYDLANAGVHATLVSKGLGPAGDVVHLRNMYNGLFVQDDWHLGRNTTINMGVRWDYDSEFPNKTDFSPRLGVSWSLNAKTVLKASWGTFYDHFRMGVARQIPAFGGANVAEFQDIRFPRLFYGVPTVGALHYGGLCLSHSLTDAEIASSGATCEDPGHQLYGVDHLNGVVVEGHAPLLPDAIVTQATVASLTGLTPQQFADEASAAVGQLPGFFYWGGGGNLTVGFLGVPAFRPPIAVDPRLRVPHSQVFHVGLEREIRGGFAAYADYFFKDIRNILGIRVTNLAFEARLPDHLRETLPGTGDQPISTYGPWYSGRFQAAIAGLRTRTSGRFMFEATYTFAHAIDNLLNASLTSDVGAVDTIGGGPTDSFVGVPPTITDPVSGQSNADGPFVASNGHPVPQAGRYYYGPNLDRGPSDLASATHTLSANGLAHLPWSVEVSAIFRAQSGFHYSRSPFYEVWPDFYGDGFPGSVDLAAGRNHFVAPPFVNLDARLSKRFRLSDRWRLEALVEFFNMFNRGNPLEIQTVADAPVPFGTVTQVLPGREGQVGLKIEF